jgi:hypothetical protein
MDYVMVPIPEEHLADAKLFLMQRDMIAMAARGGTPVTEESVFTLLSALNPRARTVLLLLAETAIEGNHLTVGEIAASLGWSVHETSGIVHELRELVWEALGPVMTLMTTATPIPANGVLNWYEQKVTTWQELALAVKATEGQIPQDA